MILIAFFKSPHTSLRRRNAATTANPGRYCRLHFAASIRRIRKWLWFKRRRRNTCILRVEVEEEHKDDTLRGWVRPSTWRSITWTRRNSAGKHASSIAGRSSASNVFKANPGPRTPSYVQIPYDTWKLFINEKMLRTICECTNIYATTKDIELNMAIYELEAFIALQYARGIYNRTLPANFLWNKNYGPSIFGTTMSREIFKLILRCLRFDKKSTRTERCKDDRFAAVRDIFEQFRMSCTTKYTPDAYLTIDEQLLPLKTRCKMITYMPNNGGLFEHFSSML